MKRRPYQEGSWFAVPLGTGGYAVGLVARIGQRGVTLGYFFGPRRDAVPSLAEVEKLKPQKAVLIALFGDLGLIQGGWPVIGRSLAWSRGEWPLPPFGRRESLTGRAWRVQYDEDSLPHIVREMLVKPKDVQELPDDGIAGAGFVEEVLTKRLSGAASHRVQS